MVLIAATLLLLTSTARCQHYDGEHELRVRNAFDQIMKRQDLWGDDWDFYPRDVIDESPIFARDFTDLTRRAEPGSPKLCPACGHPYYGEVCSVCEEAEPRSLKLCPVCEHPYYGEVCSVCEERATRETLEKQAFRSTRTLMNGNLCFYTSCSSGVIDGKCKAANHEQTEDARKAQIKKQVDEAIRAMRKKRAKEAEAAQQQQHRRR